MPAVHSAVSKVGPQVVSRLQYVEPLVAGLASVIHGLPDDLALLLYAGLVSG